MKMFRRSLVSVAAVLLAPAGCERAKPPARSDSAAVHPAGTTAVTPPAPPSTWDRGAGRLLLVAADSATHAYLVAPDSATAEQTMADIPHNATITLFGRGGTVQSAALDGIDTSGACAMGSLRAAPPPRPWSVGFFGGVVAPLPVDSAAAFSPADSAKLVVDMNRLASALPNDSAGRFAGLPFVVRAMWRFTLPLPTGAQVVVAELERQLNQEATPLAERTLIVTERAPNETTVNAVYSERSYGDEETIESDDVLAATLIGAGKTPAIVLSIDFGDDQAYSLIERATNGRWQRRWTSAKRRC
jgi:hypothetical protein